MAARCLRGKKLSLSFETGPLSDSLTLSLSFQAYRRLLIGDAWGELEAGEPGTQQRYGK